MDVSHFMVGGFTAVAIAFLVWAEIRSRRNTEAQEGAVSIPAPEPEQPMKDTRKGRR